MTAGRPGSGRRSGRPGRRNASGLSRRLAGPHGTAVRRRGPPGQAV